MHHRSCATESQWNWPKCNTLITKLLHPCLTESCPRFRSLLRGFLNIPTLGSEVSITSFPFLTFWFPSNSLLRYFKVVQGSAYLIQGFQTSSEMSSHLSTWKPFWSCSGCVSDELRTLFHFPLLLSFINNYLLFSFPNFTHYCLYFTIRFPTLLSLFNN